MAPRVGLASKLLQVTPYHVTNYWGLDAGSGNIVLEGDEQVRG